MTGGLWGLAIGLIAAVLLVTFLSGGNTLAFGFLIIAAPVTVICGLVFGIRGALRVFPFLQPLRLSNTAFTKAVLIAIGIPGALIAAFYLPFNPMIPPSDTALLNDFKRNEATLNQIVGMIKQDKGLERVDDTWTMPENPATVKVTEARLAAYRRLLQKAGISRGFDRTNDEIQFFNWTTGSAVSSDRTKGFAYLEHAPAQIRESLDGCDREAAVYRHIKGNWYLFYQFVPG